jgi:hypothetical protein
MNWNLLGLTAAVLFAMFLALAWISTWFDVSRPANEWHAESWMGSDPKLPATVPTRILSLTDLPSLDPMPGPDDFLAAIRKSKAAGCRGAVLTHSWPSLEPREGAFTLEGLKGAVALNEGRVLYLGIQVLNTTVKELPSDLAGKAFDDPQLIGRFRTFLDGLAPLLQHRVRFLSIGNESDVYLSIHPDETDAFGVFLNAARDHAKHIAPEILVGTTLTDAGAAQPKFEALTRNMDAHFLTYYHGQVGVEGAFKDTAKTKDEILGLADQLDERPILFQEIGFPADDEIGSPEKQAAFVKGVFDAWDELGVRVPFANYFMLYDFPKAFVREQVSYYGVTEETETLTRFLSSLGLHRVDGAPRPAWEVFERRGRVLARGT